MSSRNDICYYCGKPSTTREHVPPRSFFPKGKRENLISVPSCEIHNNNYSNVDERFRFLLQACASSSEARKAFSSSTIRGLKRPDRQGLLRSILENTSTQQIDGSERTLTKIEDKNYADFVDKTLRGLYFEVYDEVFEGVTRAACSHFYSETQDLEKVRKHFDLHKDSMKSIPSAQPEIFRCKIGDFLHGIGPGFSVVLTFYDELILWGLGFKMKNSQPDGGHNSGSSAASIVTP